MSFADHATLIALLIDRRQRIAEQIEARLLNARARDVAVVRGHPFVASTLDACVFQPDLPGELARLKDDLTSRHVADGFEAVPLDGFARELDPVELIGRTYGYWDDRRWPGHSGRMAAAQTIAAVVLLRRLEHLAMRVWDDGDADAGNRLDEVQALVDRLNASTAAPTFVRDACWLVQTAQGPLTRDPAPYFRVADRIAALPDAMRTAVHAAGARLAGGHLRSQLRYRAAAANREADDPTVLAITRNSNAMDGALLLRDLAALLGPYRSACEAGDRVWRRPLADAILQGLSADPDLFLARLDLLRPYLVVEDVFVTQAASGPSRWTPAGRTQMDMIDHYVAAIGAAAGDLLADLAAIDPAGDDYSPFGITYGFCADLLANIAMASVAGQPRRALSFEDVFESGGPLAEKRAWSDDWRALPRRAGEQEHFQQDAAWAREMFDRTRRALEWRARIFGADAVTAAATPTLWVTREAGADVPASIGRAAVNADDFCFTSDLARSSAGRATAWPKSRILEDRREARYLASADIDGKWFAVSKAILTEFLARGRDAVITGVPEPVVNILTLTAGSIIRIC